MNGNRSGGMLASLRVIDILENLHAPVLVATMETQRERILSGNFPVFLILDECQMLADEQSGLNYEMAMGFLHPQRACCS